MFMFTYYYCMKADQVRWATETHPASHVVSNFVLLAANLAEFVCYLGIFWEQYCYLRRVGKNGVLANRKGTRRRVSALFALIDLAAFKLQMQKLTDS